MKTTVVHCKREPYDVYIGRGGGSESIWGNPFVTGKDGTRDEVIRKHREWVVTQPHLMRRLWELRGKRLGCWCKSEKTPTLSCHGDVLAELANALPDPGFGDIDLEGL